MYRAYERTPEKPFEEESKEEKFDELSKHAVASNPDLDPYDSNVRTNSHYLENLQANPAAKHVVQITRKHGVGTEEALSHAKERLGIWPHAHAPEPGKDDKAIAKLQEHDDRHPYTAGLMPKVHHYFRHGWTDMPFHRDDKVVHPVTGETGYYIK